MGWLEIGLGAATAAAGMIGGSSNDPPAPARVDTQKHFKSPVAEQLAKDQLATAAKLAQEANDPRVAATIYSLLPADNMGPQDFSRYEKQFTEIKKGVTDVALRESEKMAGMTLQSLVERGVISPEQAKRQKIENKAKVDAIANIAKKRLEAGEEQMARDSWVRRGSEGLQTAGMLAREQAGKRDLGLRHKDAARRYEIAKKEGRSTIENALARENTSMDIGIGNQRFVDNLNLGVTGASLGAGVWKDYKQAKAEKAFADKYPEFKSYFDAKNAGIFG